MPLVQVTQSTKTVALLLVQLAVLEATAIRLAFKKVVAIKKSLL
jgi:hypothetical protein